MNTEGLFVNITFVRNAVAKGAGELLILFIYLFIIVPI